MTVDAISLAALSAPTGGTLENNSSQSDNTQGYDGFGSLSTAGATLLTITIPAGLPYKELYVSALTEMGDSANETVSTGLSWTSSNRIDTMSPDSISGTAAGAVNRSDMFDTILVSNTGSSFSITLVPLTGDSNTSGNLFSIQIWGIM